jgi:hypothetical protein
MAHTMDGKLDSFEAGVAFGFQRAMDATQCPILDDTLMGPSPEAFEAGMQAGFLAGFRKRQHV